MLLRDDRARIRHILDAIREAMGYVADIHQDDFRNSRQLLHSVVRCVEIVGEAACRLSRELREKNPQIPWADIVGMRNRIVHAYFDIDVEIIWRTASEDFKVLLIQMEQLARDLDASDSSQTT